MSWRKGLVWKWFIWDVILEDKREQGRSGKDTVATSFVRTEGFIEWRYLEKGQAVLPELSSQRNGGRTALPWLLPEGQVLEVLVFRVWWCQSSIGSRSIYPTCTFLRQGKIHGVDMKKCLDSFASLTDVQGLCLDLEGTQFFSASVENSSHSKWKKKKKVKYEWLLLGNMAYSNCPKCHILFWKQFCEVSIVTQRGGKPQIKAFLKCGGIK